MNFSRECLCFSVHSSTAVRSHASVNQRPRQISRGQRPRRYRLRSRRRADLRVLRGLGMAPLPTFPQHCTITTTTTSNLINAGGSRHHKTQPRRGAVSHRIETPSCQSLLIFGSNVKIKMSFLGLSRLLQPLPPLHSEPKTSSKLQTAYPPPSDAG
jgi:hypothetical protein